MASIRKSIRKKTRRRASQGKPRGGAPLQTNRFRSTFDHAAVGIIHSTTEGRILEVNRKLCDLLGYASSELRTLNTRDLTHPDDRDRQDAQRLELVSGLRGSFSSEKRYLRKDGQPIWVNRTVALGHERPGADPYLIHTIEDITERKRAEQALQQSQGQYSSLVDSLDSILWEADAQTFRFTFVSQQAEKLLGYPVERWLEEPAFWQDHIHPEDRDWAFSYCVAATREMRPHDFEYRMIAADGRVVWLRDIVNVVVENGRPVRSRGVMVDITAGKQAEMDARRHARARRVLAECSHALVHAADEAWLLREMCRIVVESGEYVQAHIGLALNDEEKTVDPVASAGYEAGYLEGKKLRWGGDDATLGMTGRVIASGERAISRDILADASAVHLAERARKKGFRSMIALPLKTGGACIGAVSIYAREPDAFDDGEVALLGTLADDISFGMSGLRARAAQKRMAIELARVARARRVMAECSHALVHAVNEPDLLREMCRIIVDSGGYQQGWIGLASGDPARPILPVAQAGYHDDAPLSYAGPSPDGRGPGAAVAAVNSGEIVVVRDILNQPGHAWRRERALKNGFQSSIALPLRGEGRTLGVLVMHAPEPDAFNEEEIALLSTLADDIGYGVMTLRADAARHETEQRLVRLTRARRVMAECSQALVHATDESRLLGEMCRIAVESGGFRQAWIAEIIRMAPLRVKVVAHAGYGGGAPMTGASNWAADGSYQGLAAEAIARGEISIARDILNDPRQARKRPRALELNYQSSIALPLREAGSIAGAVVLHAAEKDAFDDEEIALLGGLVEDLSYGIANLRTQQARRQAEERLRESEQRVREVFDQAAVGIARSDLDGVLVEVNQKFCDMLGYEREELIGRTNRDITHPADYGKGARVREELQGGARIGSASGEKRFLRKDGTYIWARRTLSAAYDDAGSAKYVVAVIEDITGRKQLEQRFETTFNQAAVGIVHTALDGAYLMINRRFCEMTGYDEQELLGRTADFITHPDDLENSRRNREQLRAGRIRTHQGEKRYIRKDGRVIWVMRTASIAFDDAGQPMYVIRVIEDITERKGLEQQFQATFDQAAVGISHTALDGSYLRVNRKLCDITGYTQKELTRPDAPRLSHPDDVDSGGGERKRLLSGEISSHGNEKRYLRKDGKAIWVNRTESLARDARGEPMYFIRVIEDITERKELERQFRDNFDQAAVGIAHVDFSNNYIRVNRKFCEITGYDETELIGMPAAGPSHPEDRGSGGAERMRLQAGEIASFSNEKRYIHKSGRMLWVKRTESLARDADGKPVYCIRVIEDVTDRMRAEETIVRERALLRTIIDTLPDRIYVKDAEGRFLLENAANLKVHGIENHEKVVGKTVFDLFPREVAQRLHAEDQAIVDSGQAIMNRERSVTDATGQVHWHLTTKVPLRDAAGNVIGVVGVNRDVTERRQAEEAVTRERALLRTVVDTLPDRVYVKDLEGRYLLMNEANLKQRGLARDEIAGKTVWDIYPKEVAARIESVDRRVIESGQPVINREEPTTRSVGEADDGEQHWHIMTKVPLQDAQGRVYGIVGVNRDITERKRMEQELRENVERFQIAARATNDVIWDWNLATNRFWWSEGFGTLLGYRMEEVKPGVESWYEGIHPADRERVVKDIHRVIDSGEKSWSDEYRFRRADGSYADIFDRGYVIHAGSGKPARMIGAMMDISESAQAARRREMEHAVTSVLADSPTLDVAMPRLMRAVCEAMGWAYGARWVCDAQGGSMHRADSWSDFEADFDPADRESWLRQGGADPSKALLRRAWAEKEPVWIADFERVKTFQRGPSAKKFGLRSAFAFPVVMGGSVVALLEFFSREARQPDEGLLDVARSISGQIGQFVQRKQAEAALKEAEQQFRQLAGNIPQVFWITDAAQQETIYISPAWQEITGRTLDEIRGNPRSWLDSVHEEDRVRVKNSRKAALEGGYDENFRVVRPDGSIRWVHDRAFPVHDGDGRVYRIAGIAEDVTDRKQAEAQLMQLAHYDVLTSLPNRVLFYDRLKQSLAQAKRNQWNVGVLFIDVDRFKNVNDTLGHAVGDQLLQQVSERLTAAVRSGDTVGRLGGDEFAIVLSNLTSAQDANLVAQKILASFNDAFKLGGSEIYVTASVGISLYPDDSLDQDTLIRNADAAMYRAKELGRNNYQFYTPEMNTRAQELLSMESNLRRALDRDEFLLHFQPKASAATGEITGVEALLRWRHPERGLVSPAEFIPVLEETGLIVPVGEWVIRAACEQVMSWQRAGIVPVPVAVNLSARQFQSPRLGTSIVSVIESSGIEPRFLELEITESALMQNADSAVSTLQFLKSRGLRISIDDFGTGYSSLAYLKRFPLDALKIDRSFVRDLTTDPDDATITRAVISMAHSLGLKVIAEGVETESQFEFLAENGCDEIQGYLFARPLSGPDCAVLLKEGRRLQRPSPPVETAPVVLLVDDDDDALTLLKRTLSRDGYQILTARNAHEALDVLGRNRVDLVISDQHMPGVQGVEFLQRVKRLHPRTVRLMTSGAADVQIVTDAINKGEIFRFLSKDMREDQLRTDVREALQFRTRISQDLHPTAPGAKDR